MKYYIIILGKKQNNTSEHGSIYQSHDLSFQKKLITNRNKF